MQTSPLCSTSSANVNPLLHLASNTIREFFGPTVQTVADCLIAEAACHVGAGDGGYTFAYLYQKIRGHCARDINDARLELVANLKGKFSINRARGPEAAGYVVSADAIRAALIVLLHHSIVVPTVVTPPPESQSTIEIYRYSLDLDRARLFVRYPLYIDYAKKAIDDNAAALVEELLVHGRMLTEDAVEAAVDNMATKLLAQKQQPSPEAQEPAAKKAKLANGDSNFDGVVAKDEPIDEEKSTANEKSAAEEAEEHLTQADMDDLRLGVLESFKKLIDGGYVERVAPLKTLEDLKLEEEEEAEFGTQKKLAAKRKYADISVMARSQSNSTTTTTTTTEESTLSKLFACNAGFRQTFGEGIVWRVNVNMFHSVLRAFCFGRLVAERYGDKIPACGSLVSASLKFVAFQKFSPMAPTAQMDEQQRMETIGMFTPKDILDFLPVAVQDRFKNKAGGATANVSHALVEMANVCTWPQVVLEVEDAQGHALGGKFEIATKQIVDHLQRRVLHQILLDQHDEHAARVVAVLEARGYLEAESIAESVMVPAKDIREILHRLHKTRYLQLLNLQQNSGTKAHNPGTAVYLWGFNRRHVAQTLIDNVCLALHNIRSRRQHEMQLGKDFVERAKEPGVDENEHLQDKLNYQRFCQGLERLDKAALQLDETLMVLTDFSKW